MDLYKLLERFFCDNLIYLAHLCHERRIIYGKKSVILPTITNRRMKTNEKYIINEMFEKADVDAARLLIEGSQNIVISAHQLPDGDAIGSCLGLASYLRAKGKEVTVIEPNPFPSFLSWMEGASNILIYDHQKQNADEAIAQADLIFYLDLNTSNRMLELGSVLDAKQVHKIVIDHHRNPEIACDILFSYPQASSTCELVLRFIHALGDDNLISKGCAECLCAGMMTDTGAFQYNSNSPEFFILLAMLLSKGADKDLIYRRVFHCYNKSRYILLGRIFNDKIEYIDELHTAIFTLSKEEMRDAGYVMGDVEGFVNLPLEIKDMKLSISLREDLDKSPLVHVSIRSVDDIPANEMASRFFNGGGHLNAAGGRLECTLEEASIIAHKACQAYADMLKSSTDPTTPIDTLVP